MGFLSDRMGFPGDRMGSPGDRMGFLSDRMGFPGDRMGSPGDRMGFPGDRMGFRGDRMGFLSDRMGFLSDRMGFHSDRMDAADRGLAAMSLLALTIDCGGTLVDVRWVPQQLALDCAAAAGVEVERDAAWDAYTRILSRRWPEYLELNLRRSADLCDAFWESVTREWLRDLGAGERHAGPIMAAAERILYGAEARYFARFDDAVPALEALRSLGIRLAVLSNWDVSLHRVLRHCGLDGYFEATVASLEEGVEKPDPRIFEIALERLGFPPDRVGHVGDHPLDDLRGAQAAGMRAWLLDRSRDAASGYALARLTDLPEALRSTI
jgi:putative hydrolase of the HAD superfamily